LQAEHQLLVTGWQKVYMPCLIGNRKVIVKEIPRNEEVIAKIIETATDFWNNFVVQKTPPAPDSSTSAARILDELYPKEEAGKVTEFPTFGDEMEMLGKYDKLIEDKKHIEKDIDLIKQKLKAEMGDAEIAICGDKKIVWKTQSRPAYTVKACEFRMFKIYSRKGGK
jgi:predicted phage-related endonuclease